VAKPGTDDRIMMGRCYTHEMPGSIWYDRITLTVYGDAPVPQEVLDEYTAPAPLLAMSFDATAGGDAPPTTNVTWRTQASPPPQTNAMILVMKPAGPDVPRSPYTIVYRAYAPDGDGTVSLYYARGSTNAARVLVTGGLSPAGYKYAWDTADLSPGDYYIHARVEDGKKPAAGAWSRGYVVVGGR
jgi:hypothetical protein